MLANDLKFADHLIAKSVKKGSWGRNKSWAEKFRSYVIKSCPGLLEKVSLLTVAKSNCIALGFLARVAKEKPRTTTCVDAAKRAVNFLRALAGAEPLKKDPCISLLAGLYMSLSD